MKNYKTKIIFTLLISGVFVCSNFVYAEESYELPLVRVFYKPDGSVLITHFVADACESKDTVKSCMDRITSKNPENGMPYDDMTLDQLPQDRSTRNEWRGAKGKGVWVESSLITKSEKIEEFQTEIEIELEKDEPDASKVLKLESLIEKVKDLENSVLAPEDLAEIEVKNNSMLAAIARGMSRFFASIGDSVKDGVLALTSLVTKSLSIGSSEAPAGFTIYDQKTGQPFCVVLEDGVMKNLPGECGTQSGTPSIEPDPAQVPLPEPIIEDTATSTIEQLPEPVLEPEIVVEVIEEIVEPFVTETPTPAGEP